jgi:sugar lactone lactonase YvrE
MFSKLIRPVLLIGIFISFIGCKNNGASDGGNGQDDSKTLDIIAESDELWTGIAVSKENRIFVNYPRWGAPISFSVAEVLPDGNVNPYPDSDWNEWNDTLPVEDHLVCVQSVFIDDRNSLWILDTGNPGFQGVIGGAAKLIKINIENDTIESIYTFESPVVLPNTYLNDVRIDTDRHFAYITDSGLGAIIVVDLTTGESRRRLAMHASTKAEDIDVIVEGNVVPLTVHSDGIALDNFGDYLYYQALTGKNLYRISTAILRDESATNNKVENAVELVAKVGVSDGLCYGNDGNIYLTSLEHNAIRKYSNDNGLQMVIESNLLKWPDSIFITEENLLYITTSQLHLGSARTHPYRIFRFDLNN